MTTASIGFRITKNIPVPELMELVAGVIAEMADEGVSSAEIDVACARLYQTLGIDIKRVLN